MFNKKKTAIGSALILFLGVMFSGYANAAFISCTSSDPVYDISGKVNPNEGCTILAPLDGHQNDNLTLINNEAFFGFNDWMSDGKWESPESTGDFTNSSELFDFTGAGQSGTFSKVGDWLYEDIMFIFKDGSGTNLVGYLIDMEALLEVPYDNEGDYATPFVPDVFGSANPKDTSHISVYYRGEGSEETPPVPEPGILALLGLGAIGIRLKRKAK